MSRKLIIISVIGLLFYTGCKKDFSTNPGRAGQFSVTVSSVECTSAWLTLNVEQPDNYTRYTVTRDTHTVFYGYLQKKDTLLHDTGLEPARDIVYKVIQTYDGAISSDTTFVIQTMDTTRQDFEITEFTFGSGYIRDVAIIDENNIWAVGSFYRNDTLYSALYTKDGKSWRLFPSHISIGDNDILPSDIDNVIANDVNDVWLLSGPRVIHWNGSAFIQTLLMKEYNNSEHYDFLRTVWKADDNTFIQGDYNGNLVFTNGYQYEYLDTGIRSSIYKICGAPKKSGIGYDILAAMGTIYNEGEQRILKIEGAEFESVLDWPQDGTSLYSIWFKDSDKIFVTGSAGGGVSIYGLDKKWRSDPGLNTNWLLRNIHGNDINDIWVSGEHHYIAHFNGIRWKKFPELERYGPLYGMDVEGDIMVAGGHTATLIIIKRK